MSKKESLMTRKRLIKNEVTENVVASCQRGPDRIWFYISPVTGCKKKEQKHGSFIFQEVVVSI